MRYGADLAAVHLPVAVFAAVAHDALARVVDGHAQIPLFGNGTGKHGIARVALEVVHADLFHERAARVRFAALRRRVAVQSPVFLFPFVIFQSVQFHVPADGAAHGDHAFVVAARYDGRVAAARRHQPDDEEIHEHVTLQAAHVRQGIDAHVARLPEAEDAADALIHGERVGRDLKIDDDARIL